MDYSGLRDTAQQTLQDEGGVITVTPQTKPTLDPATGDMSVTDPAQALNFYGIQIGLTDSYIDGRTREWSNQYHDSTDIKNAKAKVFLSPGSVGPDGAVDFSYSPTIGDSVLLFDGVTYRIVDATPLNPAGIILGFELTLT